MLSAQASSGAGIEANVAVHHGVDVIVAGLGEPVGQGDGGGALTLHSHHVPGLDDDVDRLFRAERPVLRSLEAPRANKRRAGPCAVPGTNGAVTDAQRGAPIIPGARGGSPMNARGNAVGSPSSAVKSVPKKDCTRNVRARLSASRPRRARSAKSGDGGQAAMVSRLSGVPQIMASRVPVRPHSRVKRVKLSE